MGGERDIERMADAILRAAGSGLRFYSMPSTREAILTATREAINSGGATFPHMKAVIEALRAATALAVCCQSPCYSSEEIERAARSNEVIFRRTLALITAGEKEEA